MQPARATLQRALSPIFARLFPDDCRVCSIPLVEISRIPVCEGCLSQPEVFTPEFFCAQCRTPFLSERPLDDNGLCDFCRRGVTSFDAAYCYGAYEGTLRELIHLLKYDRVATLAGPLGRYLAQALPREQRFDCLAPVPLHWWKRFQRGFNQCELLAEEVSRRTGLPVVHALKRAKSTQVQAGLTHSERRRNVQGAFAPRKSRVVEGKHVLLIDDVLTTGATANAAARALRAGGAARVSFLAVARVDRRPVFPDFVRTENQMKAVAGARG